MGHPVKYVVLVIVSAFGGFVGAWLLFQTPASDVPAAVSHPSIRIPLPGALLRTSPKSPRTIHFSDIEQSSNVFDQQYLAWQLAARVDVPTLKKLIRRCLDKDDPLYTRSIAATFIERYTELDPKGSMDFVSQEPRLNQAVFKSNVLTSWVRYDPQAAIDYFKQIKNQRIKLPLGTRLLEDPGVAQSPLGDQVKEALGPFASEITRRVKLRETDPVDLFRQSLTLTGRERNTQMINAVTRWADKDPHAALNRLASLTDPGERNQMLRIAISQYAQRDPKAALDWLQSNEPGHTDMQLQVLNSLAAQNVDDALPLVEDFVRRTGQTRAFDGIISIWAQQDPQKAINYVDSLDDEDKSHLYRTLAFSYLRSEPVAGLNWVVSLGSGYDDVKRVALRQLNGENEAAAEQALRNTADAATRSVLMEGIARYKARSDPKNALDWLADYSGDKGYANAYVTVLENYSYQNPQNAAQLLNTTLSGPRISAAAADIVHNWYKRDPQAAANWATSLPPSDARTGAIARLVGDMAVKNPGQAFDMSQELPPDARRKLAGSIGYPWVAAHPDQVEDIISKLNPSPQVANELRQLASRNR